METGHCNWPLNNSKKKLQAEGLFDTERKKPLPPFPRRIGVISSPSGAAVRDVLQVLERRFPGALVTLYPSSVQGANAAEELRLALELALRRGRDDVLILTRGGGSLEDLAAFNDEPLARCIAAARIPLVSAVGHEIDFTIADFVADRRAPTPSAAAELVSPDTDALQRRFAQLGDRLHQQQAAQLRQAGRLLTQLEGRLERQHPGTQLQLQQQRLDELQLRLTRHLERHIGQLRTGLRQGENRLRAQHPAGRLRDLEPHLGQLGVRLNLAMQHSLRQKQERLSARARELNAISPLAILERGYSITTLENGKPLTNLDQVELGTELSIRLSSGRLSAEVTGKQQA